MSDSIDLQHVNVKFFVKDPEKVALEDAINVFHSWIQQQKLDDLLIDVADYRHVPSGPGVILVGHHAHYALDNAEGQLGVLYNRKSTVELKGAAQVEQAIKTAQTVCGYLAEEDAFRGKLEMDANRLQVSINDRLIGPNTDEAYQRLLPDLTAALVAIFGDKEFKFERAEDPRKLLTVTVTVP